LLWLARADSDNNDADTDAAREDKAAEVEAWAEDIDETRDEGGVVTGIGTITEPDVEALNEVMVGPSDDEGEEPEASGTAVAPVADVEMAEFVMAVEGAGDVISTAAVMLELPTEDGVVPGASGRLVASVTVADAGLEMAEKPLVVAFGRPVSVREADAALLAEADSVLTNELVAVVLAEADSVLMNELASVVLAEPTTAEDTEVKEADTLDNMLEA